MDKTNKKITYTLRGCMVAAAFCLLTVVVTGCNSVAHKKGESTSREAVPVKVMSVKMTENTVSKTYVGTVHASKSNILTSPCMGTLADIKVRQGQRVSAGEVLAVIESQRVRSSLEMAEATLRQARDGYDRAKEVYGTGSIADVKMVEIETKLAQAEAAYKIAGKALEDCSVKAPFSGVIGDVYADEGVELSIADPIVKIMDISSIEIHFPVPESEIISLKVGAGAFIEVPATGRENIPARITVKGISASPLSHSYECVLKPSGNSEGLMPGMVCKVSILEEGGIPAAVIPASAVKTDIGGRYVWGIRDDMAVKVPVKTGGFQGNGIIIADGISPDDLIITEGSQKVSSGMKVRIIAVE